MEIMETREATKSVPSLDASSHPQQHQLPPFLVVSASNLATSTAATPAALAVAVAETTGESVPPNKGNNSANTCVQQPQRLFTPQLLKGPSLFVIQGSPDIEKKKRKSNNEVKIAIADKGAAPATANAVNPNEKMGVFKDPLSSHAPVATTPEVSTFLTPRAWYCHAKDPTSAPARRDEVTESYDVAHHLKEIPTQISLFDLLQCSLKLVLVSLPNRTENDEGSVNGVSMPLSYSGSRHLYFKEAAGTSPGDRVLRGEVVHGFSIRLEWILPRLMPERLMETDCQKAIGLRWFKSSSTQEFTDP
ncbi:hypothetical protein ACLOJK_037457 [Asimina triloba]